jgi:hypothetical protein
MFVLIVGRGGQQRKTHEGRVGIWTMSSHMGREELTPPQILSKHVAPATYTKAIKKEYNHCLAPSMQMDT